jgi:hypothetical protein
MSSGFNAATKKAQEPSVEEIDALEPKPKPPIPVKTEDKSLGRKIMESYAYDNSPTARLILNQLTALRMDEDSRYPKDSPYKNDKEGWCWMAQWELSLRCGLDSDGRTFRWWIARFRNDGSVLYREWWDDNGTHHAEYKVVEKFFDAFQRPDSKEEALATRPGRYREGSRKGKKNSGMFSKSNQPKISAQRRAIREEDDE